MRVRRLLTAGVACATTSLALVTGSAQAKTPKPKLYELDFCVTYEAPPGAGGFCGSESVQVFPKSETALLDGELPGTISTHKVGTTRYTDFHFSFGPDVPESFEYNDGVKDSTGYSSQTSPGAWSFTFEGSVEAEGTWWMVKM